MHTSTKWLAAAAYNAIAAATWKRQRRRARGEYRVFVLTYHDVGADGTEREGVVAASRFRRHLRYIRRHYRIAALSEATRLLGEPGALREDVVVITLDDGYAGNYEHAWPVLRGEGVPATIFLTTGFLDGGELWFDVAARCFDVADRAEIDLTSSILPHWRGDSASWPPPADRTAVWAWLERLPPEPREQVLRDMRALCPPLPPAARPLSWEQVRTLRASGIEIGAHTVSHTVLSVLPRAQQRQEIEASRDRISACAGVTPTLFAYPNGTAADFDAATVAALYGSGFVAAGTTIRGSNRTGADRFRLKRLGVGADSCLVLAARLGGLFDAGLRVPLGRSAPMRVYGAAGGSAVGARG